MSQAPTNPVSSTSSASPKPVVDYSTASRRPKASWFNPRVLMFVLVFGGIIGWVGWTAFSSAVTGGVVNRGSYYDVDLKYISLFPLDQQTGATADVPERFRALDGKKVVLVGEMWAPNASGPEVGSFDLCYSIAKCCFSGPPQAQHFVKSVSTDGKPLPMYDGLVRVKGTLNVSVVNEGGKVQSVYRMKVDSLEQL